MQFQFLFEFSFDQFHRIAYYFVCCKDSGNNPICQNTRLKVTHLPIYPFMTLLKFSNNENDPGVYRYVLKPDLYTSLSQAKVIKDRIWDTD